MTPGCPQLPRRLAVLALLVATTAVSAARAHDFWIEPSMYRVAPGAVLDLHLRVGEEFEGSAVPRRAAWIESFLLHGKEGPRPVSGREGWDPAGAARVEDEGHMIVTYRSRPSRLELDPARFESYLEEEGLQRIISLRARRGESDAPGREIFSRCAKALIRVGDPAHGTRGFERVIGMRLELVPEADPVTLGDGDRLPVRLRFEGRPLEGALVVARSRAVPSVRHEQRTDRQGLVHVPLTRPGEWLVTAVHMVPTSGPAVDWESLWASLTFER